MVEPWKQVEPSDPRLNFRREFTKGRNYMDLLRAGVSGLAIIGGLEIPASISLDAEGSAVSPLKGGPIHTVPGCPGSPPTAKPA